MHNVKKSEIGCVPSFSPEKCLDPNLLEVGVCLLQLVREAERHDGKSRFVALLINRIALSALMLAQVLENTHLNFIIVNPNSALD